MNRKKRVILSIIMLSIISCTAVFGQKTDENTPNEDTQNNEVQTEGEHKTFIPYTKETFQITINAGVGLDWYQWHFTGGIQLDYQPNPFLGLGLKTTADYGFKYGNLNINIYALYRLWWLYFGPGVSFLVEHMTLPSGDPKYVSILPNSAIASLAITLGFRFPFVRVGPGHFTLDISIDWYQTDYPITGTPPLIGSILNETINGAVYAFKPAVRLGYTF